MFSKTFPLAILVSVPLFLAAGRADLPFAWAYVLVLWLSAGTVYTLMRQRSPGLLRERMRPPSDRDRHTRLIALPLLLGHWALAGFDARLGWSDVPPALRLIGLGLVAAAMALIGWTLLSNPYASSAVRIQNEREQRVVSTGPYALIRHPMYLGVLLVSLGSGAALGSAWASLLLLPLLGIFVRRTLKEDRMLQRELPGYPEYAARVRWRVVPGVF
jgi:protein-S-isoprenylcysteine O-methyltransferase Ste14